MVFAKKNEQLNRRRPRLQLCVVLQPDLEEIEGRFERLGGRPAGDTAEHMRQQALVLVSAERCHDSDGNPGERTRSGEFRDS